MTVKKKMHGQIINPQIFTLISGCYIDHDIVLIEERL